MKLCHFAPLTMVKYVLHYFRTQSRGEAIRLAFKFAGVDYQESFVKFADRSQIKHKYTTKQIPVLEVDGKMIGQSKAILRYLGREFGLYGKTSLEAAYIDQAIDTMEDLWFPLSGISRWPAEEKVSKLHKYKTETLPGVHSVLEGILAEEPAGDFFVGNSISIADLFFFTTVDFANFVTKENSLEKYPKLTSLKSRVATNPKIAAWLKVRPPEVPLP